MSLRSSAVSGLKWTSVSMLVVTVLQLTQLSILARYLAPEDFGLMAILMVVIGFSQAFMDMGISNAIIHRQDITTSQLSSLYWLNILTGVFLSVIVVLSSPLIVLFYGEPRISDLLTTLSLVFVIVSFGNQYRILCQKDLRFNLIAKVELVTAVSSFSIALYFAHYGWGVYALVYAMLTQASVSSGLYLLIGIKRYHLPSLSYKHSELKGFYSFGFFQMGERSINYISANIDKMLIGKMIGVQSLGYYNMGWQLIIFPLSKINPVVNKVAFPMYAKVQHDAIQLNRYYSLSIKGLSLITIPMLAFLSFFSIDIVLVVFGEGWEQTATLIKVMSFIGILKALGNPGGALLLALGRADIGFWWNVFWAGAIAITLYFAILSFNTIDSVVYALLGLNLTVGIIWHVLIAKIGKIAYFKILLHLIKVLCVSFSIVWMADFVIINSNFATPIFRIFIAGLVCTMLYIPYLLVVEKGLLKHIKKD